MRARRRWREASARAGRVWLEERSPSACKRVRLPRVSLTHTHKEHGHRPQRLIASRVKLWTQALGQLELQVCVHVYCESVCKYSPSAPGHGLLPGGERPIPPERRLQAPMHRLRTPPGHHLPAGERRYCSRAPSPARLPMARARRGTTQALCIGPSQGDGPSMNMTSTPPKNRLWVDPTWYGP